MTDLRETLAYICGRAITAVRLEEHVARGTRSVISVWLGFSEGGIRLRTAPEGWGLVVETVPPQTADLGEYGQIEVTESADIEGLSAGQVESAWVVMSPESAVPLGICWRVQGSRAVSVYSYDDELVVDSKLADDLEGITYEEICAPGESAG